MPAIFTAHIRAMRAVMSTERRSRFMLERRIRAACVRLRRLRVMTTPCEKRRGVRAEERAVQQTIRQRAARAPDAHAGVTALFDGAARGEARLLRRCFAMAMSLPFDRQSLHHVAHS